ncbi:hypothetical protein KO493_04520 [Tamlana agarivorans]|uniref:Uncharacterized protein n=1 Tax=Pseudotamlana agarivorans TaxID=481183 RepID=A0ACC5U6T9_9FLAO|nr:hypothetical protein [Tamlana agarivorans]MBU2949958.1 hypothetical protein [Tamlana agarivorans]
MKILKITLLVALFIALFTSCTEQDLHEDDLLIEDTTTILYTDGNGVER